MTKIVKFDEQTTYMYPNGAVATPAIIKADFPAINYFTHVLEINGNVCQGVMELDALRNIHNIDPELNEGEAIIAIEEAINAPQPEPQVAAEERIAAAMEFQNLINL